MNLPTQGLRGSWLARISVLFVQDLNNIYFVQVPYKLDFTLKTGICRSESKVRYFITNSGSVVPKNDTMSFLTVNVIK